MTLIRPLNKGQGQYQVRNCSIKYGMAKRRNMLDNVCVRERCGISIWHWQAECRKRRLNQGSFVLLYFVLFDAFLCCV